MIYVKAPLRISLGGGGTDLPWWYKNNGGYLISASIDKYVHIIGSKRMHDDKIWLSYSTNEITDNILDLKNEIFKECLNIMNIKKSIEIHSMSDVPGNSGLGSSGAFISNLLYFLFKIKRENVSKKELAELACKIEMKNLKKNSGKQDQYISIYGGLKEMWIDKNGKVRINSIKNSEKIIKNLKKKLMLVYTNVSRKSDDILSSQKKTFRNNKNQIQCYMKEIQNIGYKTKYLLEKNKLDELGELFNEQWNIKKKLSPIMINSEIDKKRNLLMQIGFTGIKLIGAGGGGYFLCTINENDRELLSEEIRKYDLNSLDFNFDQVGLREVKDRA